MCFGSHLFRVSLKRVNSAALMTLVLLEGRKCPNVLKAKQIRAAQRTTRTGQSRQRCSQTDGETRRWTEDGSVAPTHTGALRKKFGQLRSRWGHHGCVGAELGRQRGRKALGHGAVVGGKHLALHQDFPTLLHRSTVSIPLQDAWARTVHQQGLCICAEPQLQLGSAAYVSLPAHLYQRDTYVIEQKDSQTAGQEQDLSCRLWSCHLHLLWVSYYEIFWYTHNLFIVFYIILMVHMIGGALKYQTNIEAHPPGCLRANQSSTEHQDNELEQGHDGERCREEAHFQPHIPQTWLWVSGPLCLYCAERFFRYIRSRDPVTIVTVIRHPCDVIELRMLKKNFKARPGQYIVLNCPGVSSFENHPFTLTMCPSENKETFGIHLRIVGDWTERFTQLLLPQPRIDLEILPMVQQRRYPKLYVDGPFGSPSAEVFNYDVSVCVAGGIGVTPFACVLHALLSSDGWTGFRLQRLYFVWVCRELHSFYWFAELLCALHQKLWQENRPDYFNLKLYVSQRDNLPSMSEEKYGPLISRLLVGRPRWNLLFDEIEKTNRHKRVGVFCCGPKGISRTLHRLCNSAQFSGTTFEFNKESFS
ncbi:NADPH oxidase 4 isoform X2 [Channa argus]|uniref:NADPH oxidase 4 isoform X2 n=1 Tax=Channa argus TaxID=215402 RepID=UPI00352267F4